MTQAARKLFWDGCRNTRDLGGLPTLGGGFTSWAAAVRSDHPRNLTEAGWTSLLHHGIRTVVELYTHGAEDPRSDGAPRPEALTTIRIAIEDATDAGFRKTCMDTGLWCTPLYYPYALDAWPERHASVIAAFAKAEPGGVLIHCAAGRDRTGIITLLLLSLAGVTPEAMLADYNLSRPQMNPRERDLLKNVLSRENQTLEGVILQTIADLDPVAYLTRGGLDAATIDKARNRLVSSPQI